MFERTVPLTVYVLTGEEAVPVVVVPRLSEVVLTVNPGAAITVPVTLMFCPLAPLLELVMLPVILPALAVALIRA